MSPLIWLYIINVNVAYLFWQKGSIYKAKNNNEGMAEKWGKVGKLFQHTLVQIKPLKHHQNHT